MSIADFANCFAVGSAIGFAYFLGRRHECARALRLLERSRGELPGVEPGWYPPTPPDPYRRGGYRPQPPPVGSGEPIPPRAGTGVTLCKRDEATVHPWVKRGDL